MQSSPAKPDEHPQSPFWHAQFEAESRQLSTTKRNIYEEIQEMYEKYKLKRDQIYFSLIKNKYKIDVNIQCGYLDKVRDSSDEVRSKDKAQVFDENGEPVDKYGQLVFSEPPAGNLHIIFHNTGNNDVDKGKFTTTDINLVSIRPQSFQDPDGEDNYTFARIEANGKFNGENGQGSGY